MANKYPTDAVLPADVAGDGAPATRTTPEPATSALTPSRGASILTQPIFLHRGSPTVAELVRVAGAGLAGLTAANVLATAGREVLVYERKSRLLPSSGPHTEGIRNYRPVDALDELRSHGFDLKPFATVQRTIRRSPQFSNVLRGPAHYLFSRGREEHTVDQVLYHRAKAAGVQFCFAQEIEPTDADIVATGPPQDRFNVLGAGYTFTAKGSTLQRDAAYALFDNEVAPSGYLTVTPGIELHSIYSVSWKDLNFDSLISRTESAFEIPWIKELLGESRRVSKIHGRAYFVSDPIATAEQEGTLLAGEAGGFQDAVAGFGFRYAVITGSLAARAVLDGKDYRDLLKRVFADEFHRANAFRTRLNQATNEDYDRMVAELGPEITLEEYTRKRVPRGF